jgi:hypothetical protein
MGALSLLSPQLPTGGAPPCTHYGLGVWINQRDDQPLACFVEGLDPGVVMRLAWYPEQALILTVLGNIAKAAWLLLEIIQSALGLP